MTYTHLHSKFRSSSCHLRHIYIIPQNTVLNFARLLWSGCRFSGFFFRWSEPQSVSPTPRGPKGASSPMRISSSSSSWFGIFATWRAYIYSTSQNSWCCSAGATSLSRTTCVFVCGGAEQNYTNFKEMPYTVYGSQTEWNSGRFGPSPHTAHWWPKSTNGQSGTIRI